VFRTESGEQGDQAKDQDGEAERKPVARARVGIAQPRERGQHEEGQEDSHRADGREQGDHQQDEEGRPAALGHTGEQIQRDGQRLAFQSNFSQNASM
jgi:hypothetical protein